MNVHISYKVPKDPGIEREIEQQISKLEKRLQIFRPDLVHFRGVIEQNSPREGFVVSLDLRLPSGDIAARESGSNPTSAIKGAFDDLIEQVVKHKGHLRNQYKWPRRRSVGRTRPQPQVPFEETIAAVQPPKVSDGDISAYVNANLPRLIRFVERELRYRENAGELRPGQLSPDEVIDEAIANALGDGTEKPELLALEPWLYRLSIRAMADLVRRAEDPISSISLDHSGLKGTQRANYDLQLEYHQGYENEHENDEMGIREIIPDPRVATPEATVATTEMIELVEASLLSIRRQDREAFLLFAIEGFTLDEIAVITDRPAQQVRKAIERARNHLQKTMNAPSEFKEKLLQHSKIA